MSDPLPRAIRPDDLLSHRLGEIYVMLHMECDLKCKVCPYWGVRGACRSDDFQHREGGSLERDALRRFLDQAAAFSPHTLTLSGGEPLQADDWVEVAAHARQCGLSVSLSTNALHVPQYYDEIFALVDGLHVSLGGTREILSQIRAADFGYDEVLDCLSQLAARKAAAGRRRPSVRLIYVVSHLSYHRLEAFHRELGERGVTVDNFYFQHVIYIDEQSLRAQQAFLAEQGLGSRLWEGYLYEPGPMDLDLLSAQMTSLARHDNVQFSPRLSSEELALYYDPARKATIAPRGRCSAPWTQLDLYPSGDVQVCPDYVLGNIRHQSLEEIWNGERAQTLRRQLLERGRFPGCTSCFYYYVSHEDPLAKGGPAPATPPSDQAP